MVIFHCYVKLPEGTAHNNLSWKICVTLHTPAWHWTGFQGQFKECARKKIISLKALASPMSHFGSGPWNEWPWLLVPNIVLYIHLQYTPTEFPDWLRFLCLMIISSDHPNYTQRKYSLGWYVGFLKWWYIPPASKIRPFWYRNPWFWGSLVAVGWRWTFSADNSS